MSGGKNINDEPLMFVEARIVLRVPVLRECGETFFGGEMRVREVIENWPVYKLHGTGYVVQSLDAKGESVWKSQSLAT